MMKRVLVLVLLAFATLVGVTPAAADSVFPCPRADLNHDGIVDVQDLNIINADLGSVQGSANYVPQLDFNNDGVINSSDVDLVQRCQVFYRSYNAAQ